MKDVKGTEIKRGDLLLNLTEQRSPFDAWALLICVPCPYDGLVIRDLNAWNVGWDPEDTFNLGSYTEWKGLLGKDYDGLCEVFKEKELL